MTKRRPLTGGAGYWLSGLLTPKRKKRKKPVKAKRVNKRKVKG